MPRAPSTHPSLHYTCSTLTVRTPLTPLADLCRHTPSPHHSLPNISRLVASSRSYCDLASQLALAHPITRAPVVNVESKKELNRESRAQSMFICAYVARRRTMHAMWTPSNVIVMSSSMKVTSVRTVTCRFSTKNTIFGKSGQSLQRLSEITLSAQWCNVMFLVVMDLSHFYI